MEITINIPGLDALTKELRRLNDRQEGEVPSEPRPTKEAAPQQGTINFRKKDYSMPGVADVAKGISKKTGQPSATYRKEIRARYKTFMVGSYERMSAEDAFAFRSLYYKPVKHVV